MTQTDRQTYRQTDRQTASMWMTDRNYFNTENLSWTRMFMRLGLGLVVGGGGGVTVRVGDR